MTDVSVYVGAGHPTDVDQLAKSTILLDLADLLEVAPSLRKMKRQRPDVDRRINSPIRSWGRKLPVELLGQADRFGKLVNEGNRPPISQFIVALGKREW